MTNLPENFKEKMKVLLKDEFDDFLTSYDEKFFQGFRLNRLKVFPGQWERLSDIKTDKIPWIDNGYYYEPNEFNATKHPFYYAGLYYIQEPSAQTPANLLPVEPYDRVLDLCAAPGGKSTELAAKLGGKGVLVSNDISATRAKALLKNLGVFGVKNALITSETPEKLAEVFKGYFNKILIDAPCSGEGMFRKDPKVIKNWEQYGTGYYSDIQREILPNALKMLSDDGYMLYSTCTFSPEENEGAIDYLLGLSDDLEVIPLNDKYEGFSSANPEWANSKREEIRGAVRIFPHKMKGEGHFCCLIHKKGNDTGSIGFSHFKPAKLTEEEKDFLKRWAVNKEDFGRIELHGDKFYLVPEGLPDIKGLRVLRNGLYLGDRKKGRFEPSEPFAMSLLKEEAEYFLDLKPNDTRVEKYLKCETIDITEEDIKENSLTDAPKGSYVLIGVSGFPLGFGKLTGTAIKNKYFAGWRIV